MKLLIYRKKRTEFNSIENVFNTLLPFLDSKKTELPFFSKGLILRINNIFFIRNKKAIINHITGNDHYLALGLAKNTVILTIHDIEILKRKKGLKKYILKKIWFDWAINQSAIVTTISEFSKKELLNLKDYKTPIKIIYNPITLPIKFQERKFDEKCPNILQIGTKENKNLYRLIKSLTGINCRLTIVGKITKNQKNLLNLNDIDYIEKYQLSTQEIINEYYKCDILSFVSTYEGFGLPIIEAQASGRVVISSNIASMPEVAGDGALLVDPFSIEKIKEGVLKLIKNRDLRTHLINKGFNNVKRFEPKNIANQYQNLYKELIDVKKA